MKRGQIMGSVNKSQELAQESLQKHKDGIELKLFEVGVLPLKPDDIIVLKYPGHLSDEATCRLKQSFRDNAKINNEIMLLGEGLDIEILRKYDIAATTL